MRGTSSVGPRNPRRCRFLLPSGLRTGNRVLSHNDYGIPYVLENGGAGQVPFGGLT